MEVLNEIVQTYLLPALGTALVAIFTWLGAQLKRAYQERVNTDTKRAVAGTVVRAVEQLYSDLAGEKRLQKALEGAREILAEKGLTVSDLELRMLIEAAVQGLNTGMKE